MSTKVVRNKSKREVTTVKDINGERKTMTETGMTRGLNSEKQHPKRESERKQQTAKRESERKTTDSERQGNLKRQQKNL